MYMGVSNVTVDYMHCINPLGKADEGLMEAIIFKTKSVVCRVVRTHNNRSQNRRIRQSSVESATLLLSLDEGTESAELRRMRTGGVDIYNRRRSSNTAEVEHNW